MYESSLITEVFTSERCKALGFAKVNNTRVLSWRACDHNDPCYGPLLTLGDLAKKTEGEMRRAPNMGKGAIEYIKAVLAQHQLQPAPSGRK